MTDWVWITNMMRLLRSLYSIATTGFFGLVITLCALSLAVAAPVLANSAELVIKHGDGRVVKKTVTFKESSISGTEVLQRSGLQVSIVASSAGEAVYMIDGEGDPNGWVTTNGQTYYWNYFRLTDGKWKYASTGAGLAKIKNGDTEGWLWQAYGAAGTLPAASSTARKLKQKKPTDKGETHTDGYLGFAIIAAALLAAALFFIFGRRKPRS